MGDCGCGCGSKNVLFYACSGGANVAEVADRAARELMFAGEGKMFCLAGIGAAIESFVEEARGADLNVVIDGCPMDCAKKIFEKAGLDNYVQLRITDIGIEKQKGVRITDEQVRMAVEAARGAIC